MEDIGGIIFYIIAAIIGIVTTVGKKKRDAAKMPPPVNSETIDKEVFGEGFEDPVFEEIIAEQTFEPSPVFIEGGGSIEGGNNPAGAYSWSDEFDFSIEGEGVETMADQFISEGISAFSPLDENIEGEIIDEIALGEDTSEEMFEEFDLRKAVIYSEILNRKYY